MSNKFLISLATIAFSFSIQAKAAPVLGSVSTSTGGTGIGTIEPVDGVLINPSSIARIKTKHFSFNYAKEQMAITIADNGKDALFPAAVAFSRTEIENFKTQTMSLVLAYALTPKLSLGANLSLVEYINSLQGAELKERQSTADIGISYVQNPAWSFGLVAYKAVSSGVAIDPILQKQKSVGAGMAYTYQNFVRFRYDVETAPENKTDRLIHMAGIETYLNDWVVFRFGYQNNNAVSKNFSTAGAGFMGPQFSFNYGYLANVDDRKEDKHTIDIGVPF